MHKHKHRSEKKKYRHRPHGHATGHGGHDHHHPGIRHCGHHGRLALSDSPGQLNEERISSRPRPRGLRPPGTGAIPQLDVKRCKACGKCRRACAFSAIRVEDDIARIDERLCSGCGACIDACPTSALSF